MNSGIADSKIFVHEFSHDGGGVVFMGGMQRPTLCIVFNGLGERCTHFSELVHRGGQHKPFSGGRIVLVETPKFVDHCKQYREPANTCHVKYQMFAGRMQ